MLWNRPQTGGGYEKLGEISVGGESLATNSLVLTTRTKTTCPLLDFSSCVSYPHMRNGINDNRRNPNPLEKTVL